MSRRRSPLLRRAHRAAVALLVTVLLLAVRHTLPRAGAADTTAGDRAPDLAIAGVGDPGVAP